LHVSPQEFLRFSMRQRLRILVGLFGTVGVVLVLTLLTPPIYEAEALVLVKFGREYFFRSEAKPRDKIAPIDREAFLNTELQIVRSRNLARKVVSAIGVNALYPRLSSDSQPSDSRVVGAAVATFSASLAVSRKPDSDVIRISFQHSDAELAARALNLLVEQFKEEHLQAFSDPQSAAFLQDKVNAYREALAKSEEKMKSFQLESKSFSVDDQRVALFQQRREVEAGLKDARNQIAGLQEKLKYLRSEQEKLSADTNRAPSEQNKTISDARAQLLDLQLQEQKLLSSFNESSRNVQRVRNEIQLVKEFLEAQKVAIGRGQFAEELDGKIVNAAAELRYQQARRDSLLGQIEQIEKQLGEQTSADAQYRDLLRERQANEKNYQAYLEKFEEARISEEMDREKIANISVIQDVAVPLNPVWPSKSLNLLVGMVLGLAIGYGWAFASERLGWEKGGAQVVAAVR
jgi:uncharacterized protein involved in exopolysaccharide biosynthesis